MNAGKSETSTARWPSTQPWIEPLGGATVQDLLARRRNTSPRRLTEPGPDAAALMELMRAAVAAPDHGHLTPWHFVLIPPDMRPKLGQAFVSALIERDPGATQVQLEAAADKALRAPCLVLAVVHGDAAHSGIPESERLISLGCAIQNILLAATSMGFASGLTSGRSLGSTAVRTLFGLDSSQQAVCFVAIGTESQQKPPRQRPDPGSVMRVLRV